MTHMKLSLVTVCLLFITLMSCERPTEEQTATTAENQSSSSYQGDVVTQPTQPTTRGADISLEVEERDFGTIWDFQPVTTTFPFTNTGNKTLVLTRLQAGCGCTVPVADKNVLQPGESGTITVTFDPKGKSNKQDKKVTIFSNSVNYPEKSFWIRSYVNQFVEVGDKFLKLNEMTLGQSHSVEFDFIPVDPDFKILTMSGTGKHGQYISAEEIEVPEGASRRIRIHVSPSMPWGAFHSQLQVTGSGKTPDGASITHSFTVFANGKTYGKIHADNHIISVGTLRQGGSYHKRNRIYRIDGEPFQVLNTKIFQPTVSGINATTVQNIDGSYEIIITGTIPQSYQGTINAELMVETDVLGEEVLKFRIAGVVPKR